VGRTTVLGMDVEAASPEHQPPNQPWLGLHDTGHGYLSFYYSDPLARYPVRELTRPGDNKSDPNIETGTYGLFSTCEPKMRNRVVVDGAATLLFVTRRGGRRVLAGYYHVGWFTEGALGADQRDWALAADAARFIDPIPLEDLATAIPVCAGAFRTYRRVGPADASRLRAEMDARPDRTPGYLGELTRIERFAARCTGYAYPSWGRETGFGWESAHDFYRQADAATAAAPNSSRTNRWRCTACRAVIPNDALLKQCPACRAVGTLSPFHEED
jgi:hypothetical protein